MRTLEAYKLRTEIAVDAAKGRRELQTTEKDVDKLGARFAKLGPEITKSMKGAEAGAKFGQSFGSSATAVITGSFDTLGQTLGSLIGTGIAPGIGTAIGSTLGSGFDKIAGKILGTIGPLISRGIEINELTERLHLYYTTFIGDESKAESHLATLRSLARDSFDFQTFANASQHMLELTDSVKLTELALKAAADQAAALGGSVDEFQKIVDVLGVVAETGKITERQMKALFKTGVDVPRILAQAFGKSEAEIKKLLAEGRINGRIAAGLISYGIEQKRGGYAGLVAKTTGFGRRGRFQELADERAAEGTKSASQALSDMYQTGVDVFSSPQAQQFVKFIDEKTGSLINMVEKASRIGVNLAEGLGSGITSGDALSSLKTSFTSLGDFAETSLKDVFGIQSPSQRMIDKVGIPIGEGIGVGTSAGMINYASDHADEDVRLFIKIYADAARKAQEETGVPASVTMAQAILESGTGKSGLTRKAKNFFGIKGRGPAGSVTMRTREETRGGASYYVNAPFRAYNSADESFLDHARFLQGPRYRGAMQNAGDPKAYARSIAGAGYATDRNYAGKLGGLIDKYGLSQLDMAANGAAITDSNPMPVRFAGATGGAGWRGGVRDPIGGASQMFGQSSSYSTSASFDQSSIKVDDVAQMLDLSRRAVPLLEGLAPAIANTVAPAMSFEQAMQRWGASTAVLELGLPPLTEAEKKTGDAGIDLKQKLQELEQEFGTVGIAGESLITKLSGAIGQAAGFLPQQQVGKKRGLFSKILGFAAPFLSFLPGVGPILSQVAGMASAGLAGNWSGVASGLSTGLQPGGVFRSSGGGGGAAGKAGRALGGPVRRGRSYIVGEHRPEMFVPDSDGWIHPRVGAGGGDPAMAGMFERLHGVLARLEGVRPHDVVRMGARGYIEAMDQDAGLIRLSSQRHRLA